MNVKPIESYSQGIFLLFTFSNIFSTVLSLKGGIPVRNSKITTPRLHISIEGELISVPFITSGAI